MSWDLARAQLVTIIEGTEPTSLERGKPDRFRYNREGSTENIPRSRNFWFDVTDGGARRFYRTGGYWFTGSFDIVIPYRGESVPSHLVDIMLADHQALALRLLSGANWGRPASTIVKVGHDGGDVLLPFDIEDAEGARLLRIHTHLEFTT